MAAINYREYYARYSRYFTRITQLYQQRPEVRASLELLLTLLLISFFTAFAIRPTLNTITELVAEIRSQQEILAKLNQKIDALQKAQVVWSEEEDRLPVLSQALPQKPEPDSYVLQVESLAATHGLTLNALSIGEVALVGETKERKGVEEKEGVQGVKNLDASLTVSGQYPQLLSFLRDFENLRRIIKIEFLSFGTGRGREEGSILLTIGGKVPYMAEGSALSQEEEK